MTDKNENAVLSETDEIAALLPWYVSSKISEPDRARVEAYAAKHPNVQAHIAIAQEEADAVFAANQKILAPHAAIDRLKASIASSPSARLANVRASLFDKAGAFLAGLTPRHLAYAGFAAALAIVVQAASIGALISKSTGGTYTTAAGTKTCVDKGTFALAAFQPAASAGAISAYLSQSGFKIAEGPLAGGMYRICISETVLGAEARDAALAKMKARNDLISFAAPAAEK